MTPCCRQCPLKDDRFATCGLPMTLICLEAVKKNCNNSLKDWRKQRLNTAWQSAPTRTKFSSTASSQDRLPTQHTDERTNAVRSGPVQILSLPPNQTRNISKEVKIRLAQTHSAMTRLAILWKNKAISFPTKIILYVSLVFSVLLYGCENGMLTADLQR